MFDSKTTVINLFAGPGAGKSTFQSDLYSFMKKERLKVEMVREVAKKWAWRKEKITPVDQLNIIGQQILDESDLYGKVDYIVTDSPILLGAFYMQYNFGETFMSEMVHSYMKFAQENGVEFKNFYLCRNNLQYETSGRFQTISQINTLDEELEWFLWDYGIAYDKINCKPEERIDSVWSKI